jgi:hypothetical protein
VPKKPKKPQRQTWHIYHFRGTPAQYLGMVEASDADAAIKKAIEGFKVPPQQHKRLVAVLYKQLRDAEIRLAFSWETSFPQ